MKFALTKTNFILMAIAFVIIVVGFALMYGSTTEVEYNPDVFSTRRIVVAPIVCMTGFVMMIFAIMWRSKKQ